MNKFLPVAVLLVLGLLTACGNKTRPVPPQAVVPVAINDLAFALTDNSVALTWSSPKISEKGLSLTAVDGFEVLRAVIPAAEYCPDCPAAYAIIKKVPGGPLPASGRKQENRFTEPLRLKNHYYLYKIRSRAGFRLFSRDSNRIAFLWTDTLKPVSHLQAKAGDKTVTLTWEAVVANPEKSQNPAVVYQVYRRSQDRDNFQAIGQPTAKLKYVDRAVQNGHVYAYRITSLLPGQQSRETTSSDKTVQATPRDLTPPAPPRDLQAVRSADGIRLIWSMVVEPDLDGFRVYRRRPEDTRKEQIGTVSASKVMFTDTGLRQPGTWYYSVTSFDRATPPNESLFSREVEYQYE